MNTIEEIKQEIASEKGYGSWKDDMLAGAKELCTLEYLDDLITEVAKRYAQPPLDEREVMIKAFVEIRKEFVGRDWLMVGRGPYEWDDDKYKQEVRYIMDAFNDIEKNMWKNIKSKTFEYRNQIKKEAVNAVLQEAEERIKELKMKEEEPNVQWDRGYNFAIRKAVMKVKSLIIK